MDAADLRVFEAVARSGGIGRAALQLNTVQSNVTQRIHNLEAELGTPLFRRHRLGVTLTPAGRRLLPYAERARLLFAEACRAVADDGTPQGPLVIGSLETTAGLRLPPLLASFAARYPAVDLVLVTGTTATLAEGVVGHRLDGAFVCGPVDHPEIAAEVLFHEELAIATAPAWRSLDELPQRSAIKIIVFRVGCSYRQRLEAVLAGRGVIAPQPLEFGTVEGILGCVAAGLGITMLPKSVLAAAERDGRIAVHPLPPEEARVETLFIRRRDAFAPSALAAFLDLARPTIRAAAE